MDPDALSGKTNRAVDGGRRAAGIQPRSRGLTRRRQRCCRRRMRVFALFMPLTLRSVENDGNTLR
ncbi:MAG: hypothetical protein E2579_21395 [Pseudomonas sp.]|nr:hypothetical protein [Pseudomonas sp.]WJH58433.1 hypothetical protein FE254_20755 [Pseudomonas guguanensis]